MELIGTMVIAAGGLAVLWMLWRRGLGGASIELAREHLEALEGAVVLLADDSVTIQKVVELLFMDASVRLTCVADGQAAIDLLAQEKVDVVIADVHMPAQSGYQVCAYAKQRHPEVAVILLVGAFEPFDEALYRECGADEVMKKPFDSTELARTTGRLLQQAAGR